MTGIEGPATILDCRDKEMPRRFGIVDYLQ
jgi:hypothetical protein